MNRLSNLIRNPKPSNTGPTMWTPNEPQNQVVQVGVDSIGEQALTIAMLETRINLLTAHLQTKEADDDTAE